MSTTVTSGQFTLAAGGRSNFTFTGDNFDITGFTYPGSWPIFLFPNILVPLGTSTSVNGKVCGSDIVLLSSIVNGDTLNGAYGRCFSFTGPNVILNPGLVIADFTFAGWLCGADLFFGSCLVDLPNLVGSGQVFIDIAQFPFVEGTPNSVIVRSNTYVFTPEPLSIALVGIGLGLVALAKSRLRHYPQGDGRPSLS